MELEIVVLVFSYINCSWHLDLLEPWIQFRALKLTVFDDVNVVDWALVLRVDNLAGVYL